MTKAHRGHCLVAVLMLLSLTACNGLPGARLSVDGPGEPALLAAGVAEQPRNLPKSRYGNPKTYSVFGKQYSVLDTAAGYQERGIASWYGSKFHGRKTSSGEVYDMYGITAAHKSLPLPTFVRVTNLESGESLIVKVNDRGPFHADRVIDLSYGAAARLGVLEKGTAPVEVTAITVNTPAVADVSEGQSESRVASIKAVQPIPGGVTVVQVGAFGAWENAEALRQKVNSAIQVNAAYIVQDPNRSLHKVRFKLSNSASMKEIIEQLEAAGIRQFAVVN